MDEGLGFLMCSCPKTLETRRFFPNFHQEFHQDIIDVIDIMEYLAAMRWFARTYGTPKIVGQISPLKLQVFFCLFLTLRDTPPLFRDHSRSFAWFAMLLLAVVTCCPCLAWVTLALLG